MLGNECMKWAHLTKKGRECLNLKLARKIWEVLSFLDSSLTSVCLSS